MWHTRLKTLVARPYYTSMRHLSGETTTGTHGDNVSRPHKAVSIDLLPKISDINTRLSTLHLTSSYLQGVPLSRLQLPSLLPRPLDCPAHQSQSLKNLIVPEADSRKSILDPVATPVEISDPAPTSVGHAPKHAIRMVVIRRRKMRVHQRRKRRKKFYVRTRNIRLGKERARETKFRLTLIERIKLAKKFEAKEYVKEYLKDLNEVLIPQTFHGKRRPQFLIKELMEKERLEKLQVEADKQDIITKEPLVLPGETVQEYIKRLAQRGIKV